MKTIGLYSLFVCIALSSYSQSEALNQFDAAGKKNGKWVIWLDNYWREAEDSSKAVYCRYTRYDHGENIYPMAMWGLKNWKLEPAGGNNSQTGKIKTLDGEYKWIDKKGTTRSTHKFNKGECVVNIFFRSSGTAYDKYDYTKKWNGLNYTWLITQYDKKGNTKYFYAQKYKGKWTAVQDFADSIVMDTTIVIGDSTFITGQYFLKGKLMCHKGLILVRSAEEPLGQFTRIMYHGKHTDWYENGQKQLEGENYYGQKTGEWKYWDKSGNEIIPKKDYQ